MEIIEDFILKNGRYYGLFFNYKVPTNLSYFRLILNSFFNAPSTNTDTKLFVGTLLSIIDRAPL